MSPHPLDLPLAGVAAALRRGDLSATELLDEALGRHARHGERLHAYMLLDEEGARAAAAEADARLARDDDPPPLCGIPVSVKDLYGVRGLPTFAGTARRLPDRWSEDGWLVARLRAQGGVIVGKTHTVELAYGGVGINPHWGTPRNPWDPDVHRIPGGSSCGAGVSLHEGSALVALGSDTGGSVRIPASLTGTVGHRTTRGRWPTDGVVPLSSTLDTVGALTRSVADSAWFFGAVDPAVREAGGRERGGEGSRGADADAFLRRLEGDAAPPPRIVVPDASAWADGQPDIVTVLGEALDALRGAGWSVADARGGALPGGREADAGRGPAPWRLLEEATELYASGAIGGAECRASLEQDLPGWLEILHPTVGSRLAAAPSLDSDRYRDALATHRRLAAEAAALFAGADVLVLPTATLTPPPVSELEADLDRYGAVNMAVLRPTCGASVLGLTALSMPVGLDAAGMPVGLQLLAPGGADTRLLAAALAAERVLGTAAERLGRPPGLAGT